MASPTSQKAGVKPISFVLRSGGSFSSMLTLKIRPEDLTRTEPSRVAVHQTLGRGIQGWADNFGPGLPSVVISGHTGWSANGYSPQDGYQAFMALNELVYGDYHRAKQAAIDGGQDPASVQLIFIDTLDDFVWNVAPMVFVLRRNRSRPLLLQYNITLQAISDQLASPIPMPPILGDLGAGLEVMDRITGLLRVLLPGLPGLASVLASAAGQVVSALPPALVDFAGVVLDAMTVAGVTMRSAPVRKINEVSHTVGQIAQTAREVFRVLAATPSLPTSAQVELSEMANAYNEVVAVSNNALRPRGVYSDYSGLYGASTGSSTTGGTPPSAYADVNPFELMQDPDGPITLSSAALASINTINRADNVLAPLPLAEVTRHLININTGISIQRAA